MPTKKGDMKYLLEQRGDDFFGILNDASDCYAPHEATVVQEKVRAPLYAAPTKTPLATNPKQFLTENIIWDLEDAHSTVTSEPCNRRQWQRCRPAAERKPFDAVIFGSKGTTNAARDALVTVSSQRVHSNERTASKTSALRYGLAINTLFTGISSR